MTDFNNNYAYDSRFTTRSKVNMKELREKYGLKKGITKQYLNSCFNNINVYEAKVGMPYSPYMQKYTKYFLKRDLVNCANSKFEKFGVQKKLRFKK